MNFDIVTYWGIKRKKKIPYWFLKTAICVPLNQSTFSVFWICQEQQCSQRSIYLPVKHFCVWYKDLMTHVFSHSVCQSVCPSTCWQLFLKPTNYIFLIFCICLEIYSMQKLKGPNIQGKLLFKTVLLSEHWCNKFIHFFRVGVVYHSQTSLKYFKIMD